MQNTYIHVISKCPIIFISTWRIYVHVQRWQVEVVEDIVLNDYLKAVCFFIADQIWILLVNIVYLFIFHQEKICQLFPFCLYAEKNIKDSKFVNYMSCINYLFIELSWPTQCWPDLELGRQMLSNYHILTNDCYLWFFGFCVLI